MPEPLAAGVLAVTSRPSVARFLAWVGKETGARAGAGPRFPVVHVRPSAGDVEALPVAGAGANPAALALVDLTPAVDAAIVACAALRSRWPGLPLLGLLCCPRAVSPGELRALAGVGLGSLIDSHTTPEGLVRALGRVARGETVLRLRLPPSRTGLEGGLPALLGATGRGVPASGGASTTADAPLGAEHERLLTLVARGLSDRQIGAEVALSWHTVNHRIKQLCRLLGVRNRTELAAWAAVHGLYARADPAGGDLHLLRA